MFAVIAFQELEKIILQKIDKPILFKYVDEKTINITYGKKILFQDISVNLTIVAIHDTDVVLRYEGSKFLDSIISSALHLGEGSPYGNLFEIKDNHQILLKLSKVPQLTKALEICVPESLTFSETDMTLMLRVR